MNEKEDQDDKAESMACHHLVESVLKYSILAAYEAAASAVDEERKWKVTSSIATTCAKIVGAYMAMTEHAIGHNAKCPDDNCQVHEFKKKLEELIAEGYKETIEKLKQHESFKDLLVSLKEALVDGKKSEKFKPHG